MNDYSVRKYLCAFLSVHTFKCKFTCKRICLCPVFAFTVNKTLYPFPGGNDCLTIVFLITMWYFSVYVCLPGPAPEGNQHADSSFCLPQQPVDRQRQQQPHHTNPRVVYLHALCQQVHTQNKL